MAGAGWNSFTGRGPINVGGDGRLSQMSDAIPMIHGINVMGHAKLGAHTGPMGAGNSMSARMRTVAKRMGMDWGAPYGMKKPSLPGSVAGSRKRAGTRSRKRK